MQQYQSIILEDIRESNSFISLVYSEASKRGWIPRPDLAATAQSSNRSFFGQFMCIDSPNLQYENSFIAGTVWFRIEKGCAESFNIIPRNTGQLSINEYNYIVGQLYNSVFILGASALDVKMSMTGREMNIKDYIHEDGLEALKRFSTYANKATGSNHPSDFSLWCEFLILLHKRGYTLESDKLSGWLYENGWYDRGVVDELIKQYEFSREFMKKYDETLHR